MTINTGAVNFLLTEAQVSERWRISVKTLRNKRVSGGGPAFVKLGRSVRYRLEDVVDFERAGLRFSTSEAGGSVR
jgi:hypothetical protein